MVVDNLVAFDNTDVKREVLPYAQVENIVRELRTPTSPKESGMIRTLNETT